MVEIALKIVEYIGVVSFSLSAAIIAISKKTDPIGALVFSFLTCFGGGILRDCILGIIPRVLTERSNHYLVLACIIVSISCFILALIPRTSKFITKHRNDFVIQLTDAIGLSVFCVIGVDVAIEITGGQNSIILIFCGCITGVGGGMLRDICSAEIPFILRKHIYLIPTLIGTIFYTLTYSKIPHLVSMLISIAIIISLRVVAVIFKWNLPTPKGEGEGIKDDPVKVNCENK